jgi:uncharacterized protein (TIGR02246 family)
MTNRRLFGLALGLATALVICQMVAGGKMPGNPDETEARGEPEAGKGKRAQEFIDAFNRGDAKATASFWTQEATYVDQSGREIKGRPAIEKLYAKVFTEQKGAKLTVNVTSARLISPDVALEDGTTEVSPADGGPGSVARFSAVLVKKDGEWYFESVRESVARPPTNVERFEDLEWLIGEWTGENPKGESGTASYAWAENQNFIVSSFATTLNGIPIFGGTQWIGWDAIDKEIKSWSFYSGGGTGQAVWKKDGDKWFLTTTARTADGQKVSGVNIVTKVDNDHAIWQLTKLTVNGEPKPEPQPLKLTRAKPAQP